MHVFHLQPLIWKVMRHYAKRSIVVTSIKSRAANGRLLRNHHTDLSVPRKPLRYNSGFSWFYSRHGHSSESSVKNHCGSHPLSMRDCDRNEMRLWQASEHRSCSCWEFQLITSNLFKVIVGAKKNNLSLVKKRFAAWVQVQYVSNLRGTHLDIKSLCQIVKAIIFIVLLLVVLLKTNFTTYYWQHHNVSVKPLLNKSFIFPSWNS